MHKIKYFIEQSWLLIVSAFFFGLLIAIANAAWYPKIEQNKINKLNRLMNGLLTQAKTFELARKFEVAAAKGRDVETKLYKALDDQNQPVGWAFIAAGSGFADKIELVVAVDKDFRRIIGYNCLALNETPGFGDKVKLPYYRNQFAGAPAAALKLVKTGDPAKIDSEIVAISGATVSSEAVVRTISSFVTQIKDRMQTKEPITNVK